MQSNVIKYNDVFVENVIFENFVKINDRELFVSKVWYKNDDLNSKSFFIQTNELEVHEVNDQYISFIVNNENILSDLDNKAVKKIQESGLNKKYGIKRYKGIICEATDDNNLNIIRLKLTNTKFYTNSKSGKSFNDVKQFIKKGTKMKIIFEVDKIVIDLTNKIMFTNIILNQAKLKLVPQKLVLSEYSFIDENSDSENDSSKSNNDVVLNTQTEYMEDDEGDENKSENSSSSSENELDELHLVNSDEDDESSNSSNENDESENSFEVTDFLKNISKLGKNVQKK